MGEGGACPAAACLYHGVCGLLICSHPPVLQLADCALMGQGGWCTGFVAGRSGIAPSSRRQHKATTCRCARTSTHTSETTRWGPTRTQASNSNHTDTHNPHTRTRTSKTHMNLLQRHHGTKIFKSCCVAAAVLVFACVYGYMCMCCRQQFILGGL